MKFFIFLILSLSLSTITFSQINYGIHLGMNAGAPIPSKIEKGAKGKLGISEIVGLSTNCKIKNRISTQVMLLYERKRAKYVSPVNYPYIVVSGDSIDNFSGIVEGSFNNQYITLRTDFLYSINSKLYAGVGVYMGYLLQGINKGVIKNGKAGFNGIFSIDDQAYNESKNISKIEYGLNSVVKFQIQKNINLQWLFTYGINSATIPTDNFKNKTHNIYTCLILGYNFYRK